VRPSAVRAVMGTSLMRFDAWMVAMFIHQSLMEGLSIKAKWKILYLIHLFFGWKSTASLGKEVDTDSSLKEI
jgi:hypothetical protein